MVKSHDSVVIILYVKEWCYIIYVREELIEETKLRIRPIIV